jgi:hypothetical protein
VENRRISGSDARDTIINKPTLVLCGDQDLGTPPTGIFREIKII